MKNNPILITGLGNPGKQYKNTRHNLGFAVIDALAEKLGANFRRDEKIDGDIAELNVDGQKLILVKPHTFMNKSGRTIARAKNRFKLKDAAQIWVVYDDAALPFGTLRVRLEGSAGGHNGIRSIIQELDEKDFVRFRLGIGIPPEPVPLENWVLSKFPKSQAKQVPDVVEHAVEKIIDALKNGLTVVTENVGE